MPISFNLPYAVCYPLTRMVRRNIRFVGPPPAGPEEYFLNQYRTSERLASRFMQTLDFQGRLVLDIGGGLGGRVPYWLERGASEVWCIDINREELRQGEALLAQHFPQYAGRARFLHPDETPGGKVASLAVLVDSFEHLERPAAVLDQCASLLSPGATLWVGSIGWYNYMASHCLGHVPIPWCQVIFSEHAILQSIRTLLHSPEYRPYYWEQSGGLDRWDLVETLRDRPGEPLNQLSLSGVRSALQHPDFALASFELHPIKKGTALGTLISPLLQLPVLDELLHGYYTATLRRK